MSSVGRARWDCSSWNRHGRRTQALDQYEDRRSSRGSIYTRYLISQIAPRRRGKRTILARQKISTVAEAKSPINPLRTQLCKKQPEARPWEARRNRAESPYAAEQR